MKRSIACIVLMMLIISHLNSYSQAIIINHLCAELEPIPESAILNASQALHIAYGHTSHGSQLVTGMDGLIGQTGLTGYKGDIYGWNEGGTGGALDIDDYFMPGDLGHNGDLQWEVSTRTYLDYPANIDVNVVIWSWCGGCSDNTYEGIQTYLDAMNQLEIDYPGVRFIYMTGHTDIWADATLKANNQHIRDFCISNNKILFDFADIESYDPDGDYYEFVTDNCNYYSDGSGSNQLGNWAIEWQNTHTEGVDWYNCSPAHTEALNGNLKAYAAWHLWCRLAGWEFVGNVDETINLSGLTISPNPVYHQCVINFNLAEVSDIEISVTDINGRVIDNYVNKKAQSGNHQYIFDRHHQPAGIYIVKLQTDKALITKKIILV